MNFCFVVSLLNFSAYPWPTTDGLLFASAAFYLLSISKNLSNFKIFFIALLCFLSVLTKQSFYPIPLFFMFWILINYDFKKGFFFFLISILFAVFFIFWLTTITSLSNFIQQTSNQTSKRQLLDSGFLNYFWYYKNKWIIYLLVFIPSLLLTLNKYIAKKQEHLIKLYFKNLSIILLLITIVLCLNHTILIASRVGFLCCISSLFYFIKFNLESLKEYSVVLLLLSISWCAAISLGYAYPIFFSTGIILSIIILFKNDIEFLKIKKIITFLGVLIMIIAFSYNQRPYREKDFLKLNYSLESVSPKLKFIKSSKEKKEKLLELKSLINKYGSRYIVAPNIPIAHYLFNTKSLLPADWLINTEVGKNPKLFISIASNKKNFIFLEKSFLQGEEFMRNDLEGFSVISSYIYKNFKKVNETKYFIIYNGIETNGQIPQIN